MTTHTKNLEQVHIGLTEEHRKKLIARLNKTLADEHTLYL
jgi:DNA-binding ferritin-like protein